jgi:hypothetical protein
MVIVGCVHQQCRGTLGDHIYFWGQSFKWFNFFFFFFFFLTSDRPEEITHQFDKFFSHSGGFWAEKFAEEIQKTLLRKLILMSFLSSNVGEC